MDDILNKLYEYSVYVAIVLIILGLLCLSGCSSPEIFKSKVPPPVTTTEQIIDIEIEKSEQSVSNLKTAKKEVSKLNNTLEKHQNRDIDGSGISIPIFSMTGVILIALLILFPSLIPVFIMIIKRLQSTLKHTVNSIEMFGNDDIKNDLSRRMDVKHKKLIRKIKNEN